MHLAYPGFKLLTESFWLLNKHRMGDPVIDLFEYLLSIMTGSNNNNNPSCSIALLRGFVWCGCQLMAAVEADNNENMTFNAH